MCGPRIYDVEPEQRISLHLHEASINANIDKIMDALSQRVADGCK